MINFYLSLNRQGGVEFDCHIQTCFGIVWMVRGAKKVFPTIFSSTIYVKTKSNSLPLLQKQTSFQETKIFFPKAIKYQTFSDTLIPAMKMLNKSLYHPHERKWETGYPTGAFIYYVRTWRRWRESIISNAIEQGEGVMSMEKFA